LAFYEIAMQVASQLNDHKLIATTYYNIGRAHSVLNHPREAVEAYLESEKVFERAGLRRDCIYVLSDLGTLSLRLEDYPKARDYSERSIQLAEQLSDSKVPAGTWPDAYGVAGSFSTLAELSLREGDHAQAVEHLQKSIALYQQLNVGNNSYDIYIADGYAGLGRVYTASGDYARALLNLNKAFALMKRLSNPDRMAGLYTMLGFLYMEQEDYKKAAANYNESLQIYLTRNDQMEVARVLLNLGVIEQRQGHYDAALDYFRKSSQGAAAINYKDVMLGAGEGLGVVLTAKGDYSKAIATLSQSLALAREMGDRTRQAELQWRLAEAYYKTGDGAQAETFAGSAAKLANDLRLRKLAYLATATLGQAYALLDKPEAAAETLIQATRQIESMRESVAGREEEAQLFFENKLSPFHSLIELYIKQNKLREALVYAEKSKGRVLLDVLRDGRVNLEAVLTAAERKEAALLNRNVLELTERVRIEQANARVNTLSLKGLNDQLDAARVKYEVFQDALLAAHPEISRRRGQASSLTREDINKMTLDGDTAYVEYVVTGEQVYIFVLTKKDKVSEPSLRVYPVGMKPEELASKVSGFHDMMANRNPAFAGAARDLYDLLIRPAAQQLSGFASICIVPDGYLWDVPFQALMSGDGRFLLEDHALYYAPSLTVLQEMGQPKSGDVTNVKQALIAYGNPVIGKENVSGQGEGSELCPLAEAETEVTSLAQKYLATGGKALTGREATEKSFKAAAPGYRMIHLATHGILDNRHPLYSYLLLTKTDGDLENDGLLEAREVMDMTLNADLAVLSACDTARGRVGAGEGVIGMSWAFFVAGVRTTVVSQWKVNSAGTSQLMVDFYTALKSNQGGGAATKAGALRAAALSLMKDRRYRHPFYWAGFVMVGSNN
jgi:CHAT domain-containing protein/Tfp pilus assembly protein PilF